MTTTEINNAPTIDEVEAAVAAAVAAATPTPAVEDPWGRGGPVRIGQVLSEEEYERLLGTHRNEGACHQRCAGAPHLGAYGYCVREAGHGPELLHFVIGGNTGREVTWVWQNGLELVDDSKPAEEKIDADFATVETFTSGQRVNSRDKRDKLIVLSAPKKRDEQVEILDLTHQRFRKVRKTSLVPARDDDPVIEPQEMAWVAKFIADRRANAYEIAAREVVNRRWTKESMLKSVAKIGIGEPPVRYESDATVTVRLRVPDRGLTGLDQGKFKAALKAAIDTAAKAALPEGYSVNDTFDVYIGSGTEV